jgi:hypothetical protein
MIPVRLTFKRALMNYVQLSQQIFDILISQIEAFQVYHNSSLLFLRVLCRNAMVSL